MDDRRHLSVVKTPEDERTATAAALRQIASRVPSNVVRSYDWDSEEAERLFEATSTVIRQGASLRWIEEAVNMEGLGSRFMEWLERKHRT